MGERPSWVPAPPWQNQPAPPPPPVNHAPPAAGHYGGQSFGSAVNPFNSGGGFKFDREALQKLAQTWKQLADDFQDDLRRVRQILEAQPPGSDYASGGHNKKLVSSGGALEDTIKARQKYCHEMFEKFNKALGRYAIAEDTATDAAKKAGGSL